MSTLTESTLSTSTLSGELSYDDIIPKNFDWKKVNASIRDRLSTLANFPGSILQQKGAAGDLIEQMVKIVSGFDSKKNVEELRKQIVKKVAENLEGMVSEFKEGKNLKSLFLLFPKTRTVSRLSIEQFASNLINRAAAGVFLETVRDIPPFLSEWARKKPVEFVETLGLRLDSLKEKIISINKLTSERAEIVTRFFSSNTRVNVAISTALEKELQKFKEKGIEPADFRKTFCAQVKKDIVEIIKDDLSKLRSSKKTNLGSPKIKSETSWNDAIRHGQMIRGIEKEIKDAYLKAHPKDKRLEAFYFKNSLKMCAKEKVDLDNRMTAIVAQYLPPSRYRFGLAVEYPEFVEKLKEARKYYQRQLNECFFRGFEKPNLEELQGLVSGAKEFFLKVFEKLVRENSQNKDPLYPVSSRTRRAS